MESNYQRLIATLRECFMLDQADLDFGIYRIMNSRRTEIETFLEKDLIPQVKTILESAGTSDKGSLEKELHDAIANAKALGADLESLPKVRELREKIANSSDLTALENEVFSHLTSFFRRYFDAGDFISMRRYKKDVYAIPYEGEEVKLHWANADQYYIKTSEFFKNYRFKTESGKSVVFTLVEASTEQNNNKAQGDKERKFKVYTPSPSSIEQGKPAHTIEEKDGELHVYFMYEPMDKGVKQDALIAEAFTTIRDTIPTEYAECLSLSPTEKDKSRTLIQRHINDYVKRNTFDYFIHKDLYGFLTRELDFYIKNEILYIDDIDTRSPETFIASLAMIKAVKQIGEKVITFLSSLEEFQKKLFLKKKMVVETGYCITLDRIDEAYYDDIRTNEAQIDEWISLFAIDEIDGFSRPLSREFLQNNPYLVLDTKYFDESWKNKLIGEIEYLDNSIDGILVMSENLQALNLLQERYNSSIECIYIDPPFNLGENGDFLYKTDYCDSSWITMLYDRVSLARKLLLKNGKHFMRCDNHGNHLSRLLLDSIFGTNNFQAELLVQRIRKNVTDQGKISLPLANDSLFMHFNSEDAKLVNPYLKLDEVRESYWRRMDDSAGYRNPPERYIFGKKFFPYKSDAHFKYSQDSIERMITEKRIRIVCKNCKHEHYKDILENEKCPKCGGGDFTPQYLVLETDRKILDTSWLDISGYVSTTGFSTENSEVLLGRTLEVGSSEGSIILDFFLGSGTTSAVAYKKNRKFIGIESGEHFNTIIIPRIKKLLYGVTKGIKDYDRKGGIIKYMSLESYEDALNNLKFYRTETQQGVLFAPENAEFREDYMLQYMLDTESQGSILSVDHFAHPFDFDMRITRDNETRVTRVDLVETFNYLIGLVVEHTYEARGYRVVKGCTLEGEKILIVWRDIAKHSNEDLNSFLQKSAYNPNDTEFDRIYVNGDNTIENKPGEQLWKVMLIEEEFKKKMFEI